MSETLKEIAARYPAKFNKFSGLKPGEMVVVLCPVGIVNKWRDEITTTYKKSVVSIPENIYDVKLAFEACFAEADPAVIHVMIMSYEKAKLGEKWVAAYNILRSTATFTENGHLRARGGYVYNFDGTEYHWVPSNHVIDPVTGGILTMRVRNQTVNVTKKQIEGAGGLFWYEGKVENGKRIATQSRKIPGTNQYEEVEMQVPDYIWAQNQRTEGKEEGRTKHLPLAMWQQARRYGLPKKPDETNGVANYEVVEFDVPARVWKRPIYDREHYDYQLGKHVPKFMEWRETILPGYSVKRKQFKSMCDGSEPVDEWLHMKGVRCWEEGRSPIDTLMYRYDLKEYRKGGGIAPLDRALDDMKVTRYKIGRKQKILRNPRYPFGLFIRRKYSGKVGLLIIDELHRAQSKTTDQSRATANLILASQKVIGLSGTIYGGKASSFYNLEFLFNPVVKKAFPWTRESLPMHWVRVMGAFEDVFETKPEYSQHGYYTETKRYHKVQASEIPGCSPMLYPLTSGHTLYGSLPDLGPALPDLIEIPEMVEFDTEQLPVYEMSEETLRIYMIERMKEGDKSAIAMYYRAVLQAPDSMWEERDIFHNKCVNPGYRQKMFDTQKVMTIPSIGDKVRPKEQRLIDLINDALENDWKYSRNLDEPQPGRVIVYCSQTDKKDIRGRLKKVIDENCPSAKSFLLNAGSPEPRYRMEYIDKKVHEGMNVMICNPMLVREGVDLVDFSRMIYVETHPSLFVMSQSGARTRRPNQKRRQVFNHYLYYNDVFQSQELLNVARKTAAADTLNGNAGGSLSAMSDTGGYLKNIAKIVEERVKASKEDIQAAFTAKKTTLSEYMRSSWYAPPRIPYVGEIDGFESQAQEEFEDDLFED